MRLAIASDHGGFQLKGQLLAKLREAGHEVEDLGTHSAESTDYPDYAHTLARGVADGTWPRGILVCGTGVGMAIAANRHAGVPLSATVFASMARASSPCPALVAASA